MGSRRLPGKVLKLLAGKSVLAHVVERVGSCKLVDQLVVATSTDKKDDAIVIELEKYGIPVFRGSEADVLGRYHAAAIEYDADIVVRITADCPLIDANVLCEMIQLFKASTDAGQQIDYLSNTVNRSFPIGLDVEIMTRQALAVAHQEASDPYEREHVTPYIYLHTGQFVIDQYTRDGDLSSFRWTLDTAEDFAFLSEIYGALYMLGRTIRTEDVLALLESRPELTKINMHVHQKQLGK